MRDVGLHFVRFSVDTPPDKTGAQANPATKGSGRALIFRGRAVVFNDNPANKKWARRVATVAQACAPKSAPWSGPVELHLEFRMRRPKTLPKSRPLPIVKPDLDKLTRSVKDALTGILYVDDAQIVCLRVWKRYADTPGVDIEAVDITAMQNEKEKSL